MTRHFNDPGHVAPFLVALVLTALVWIAAIGWVG